MSENINSFEGVHEVANIIDYQDSSVVSKTVLKKKTGTVTLFAFDKGEGLSEHTAAFEAIISVVDGEATITISGKENKVSAGEMIILPASQPHAISATSRFKMMLIMIRE